MKLKLLALAAALLMAPVAGFSQTQPAPAAKTTSGNTLANPISIFVAPAGGGSGLGRVISEDGGFPITCLSGCASGLAFTPTGAASLAVTTGSSRVALTSGATVLLINNGSADIYYKLGSSSVVATTSDFLLPSGRAIVIAAGLNTHVAGITGSNSSTLSVTTGTGSPIISGGGGSGGGGGGASATATAASPTYTEGATVNQSLDLHGGMRVLNMASDGTPLDPNAATPAGTNIIGKVGIDQTTIGTTNGVSLVPSTSGGVSVYVLEPAASDNHANIKNAAGQVYGIHVFNNSATINYGRLYNAASGFNGCNSATNLIYEFHIPASTSDAGFVVPMPHGIAFSTGISICVTGAYGQTNTTNATASAISLNILYK